jgi:hypothetical protein
MMRRDFIWKMFCRDYEDLSTEIGNNSLHVLAVSTDFLNIYLLLFSVVPRNLAKILASAATG